MGGDVFGADFHRDVLAVPILLRLVVPDGRISDIMREKVPFPQETIKGGRQARIRFDELEMRRLQNAPPFFDWIAFSASGTDEALVLNVLQRCKWMLQNSFSDSESVQVLGPVPMSIVKMNDRFRYRLQICCHNSPRVRQILSSVLTACGKMKELKQVSVYIENDPNP